MNAVSEQNKVYENEIHDQLTSCEKLLWSGRPAQGFRLHQGDVMAIPYSILWLAFSILLGR